MNWIVYYAHFEFWHEAILFSILVIYFLFLVLIIGYFLNFLSTILAQMWLESFWAWNEREIKHTKKEISRLKKKPRKGKKKKKRNTETQVQILRNKILTCRFIFSCFVVFFFSFCHFFPNLHTHLPHDFCFITSHSIVFSLFWFFDYKLTPKINGRKSSPAVLSFWNW